MFNKHIVYVPNKVFVIFTKFLKLNFFKILEFLFFSNFGYLIPVCASQVCRKTNVSKPMFSSWVPNRILDILIMDK